MAFYLLFAVLCIITVEFSDFKEQRMGYFTDDSLFLIIRAGFPAATQ